MVDFMWPLAAYVVFRTSSLANVSQSLRQLSFDAIHINKTSTGSSSPANETGQSSPAITDIDNGWFLETKYGVRLSQSGASATHPNPALNANGSTDIVSRSQPQQKRRYRICPDYQTSFLWKSPQSSSSDSDRKIESMVDFEELQSEYPVLAPWFIKWVNDYEESFEEQECQLGSGKEVFPDPFRSAAWECEGFFIACDLVQKEGVEEVVYQPGYGQYKLTKMNCVDQFRQLLQDIALRYPTVKGKDSWKIPPGGFTLITKLIVI